MGVGALGNVVADGLKGNIKSGNDLLNSAALGAGANGFGYLASKGIAALKVDQISSLPRSARKAVLQDTIFKNSQKMVNQNLKVFASNSLLTNIALVESSYGVFRAGIYSTIVSTVTSIFYIEGTTK